MATGDEVIATSRSFIASASCVIMRGGAAAVSFCQDKIITTGGEGGMLTTDRREIWKEASGQYSFLFRVANIYMLRGNAIRIISVRRSRKKEVDLYDGKKIRTE